MAKGKKNPRKRKAPIAEEEKENENESTATTLLHGPMYTIMSNVQVCDTFHNRYVKEMKQLYAEMDHDAFFFTFIKMIKPAMEADDTNDYAHTTLIFCAKFVSSYDSEDTHPLLADTCKWLLTSISNSPHIRFRLCQFVNMVLTALGAEAALDDGLCDSIMAYMTERLRDIAPSVRIQAIHALQRLQVPDNPDDPVLRTYQFHLGNDPSPRVRQAVITCMGRNYHTIPSILDRLWDIDEKVRRHTYLHMSSYPVRAYKVSQRLMMLEQGLNDRSEGVRKVVVTIMLKLWIESYQKNLIELVLALKLDSTEEDISRFRKIAKQTLQVIFKQQSAEDLLACLPLEEDGECDRCVPQDKLTIEMAFYWQCLAEHLQTEMAEEADQVLPELSAFCAYVEKFCSMQKSEMDQFEQMDFQYVLLSLMEIIYIYDLGDETGRGNLQKLLAHLLRNYYLEERVVTMIVRCTENLITDQSARLQFFLEIVQDICGLNAEKQNDLVNNRDLINELLASSTDVDLNLKLSSLKVKILDLEEQSMNYMEQKEFGKAHAVAEEKNAITEEYMELLKPLLAKHKSDTGPLQLASVVKMETIVKSLQIAFHMVVSPKVKRLNPSVCNLYRVFICRHIGSSNTPTREWALKCGTAYSMLYEAFAKEVFNELYSQFFDNNKKLLWQTSVECIFELLDRYGIDTFAGQEPKLKAKKTGRQLYNTMLSLDAEDESASGASTKDQGVSVIYLMSHILDTCGDTSILSCIIKGFCRLVLRGHVKSSEIVEKLLLYYFNPATDAEINQILGVFLDNLIQRKQHALLEPSLLPTVMTVLSAPYDSPLQDIRPETILRFIIDATRQEQSIASGGSGHIHNKIAQSFLHEMLCNVTNKELCKLLGHGLTTLELNVAHNDALQREMKEQTEKLINSEFDTRTVKNMIIFKDMLDGIYSAPRKTTNGNESDEDAKSDDETLTTVTRDDDANTVIAAVDNISAATSAHIDSEKDTDSQATMVENDVAPSEDRESAVETATPTTFGAENVMAHRSLRKSLNLSRSQSMDNGEVSAGEGPTRPNKIRIEARIDSDKKAAQPRSSSAPSPNHQSPLQRRTRANAAKRNLRLGTRNANASKENLTNKKTAKANANALKSKADAVADASLTHTQANENEQELSKTHATPAAQTRVSLSQRNLAASAPNTPTTPTTPITAVRKTRRGRVSTLVNSPDVIASSPEATQETTKLSSIRKITRQQRKQPLMNATAVPVVKPMRTRRATVVKSLPSSPITNALSSQAAVADDTTPRRNGRKRILPHTPKAKATTPAAASTSIDRSAAASRQSSPTSPTSPLRKQPRIDARSSRGRSQIPAPLRRLPRRSATDSSITGSESDQGRSKPTRSAGKRASGVESHSNREKEQRMRPPSRIPVRATNNSSAASGTASCSSSTEEQITNRQKRRPLPGDERKRAAPTALRSTRTKVIAVVAMPKRVAQRTAPCAMRMRNA